MPETPRGAYSKIGDTASAGYASRDELASVSETTGMLIKAGEMLHRENVRLGAVQDRQAVLLTRLHVMVALLSCLIAFMALVLLRVVIA